MGRKLLLLTSFLGAFVCQQEVAAFFPTSNPFPTTSFGQKNTSIGRIPTTGTHRSSTSSTRRRRRLMYLSANKNLKDSGIVENLLRPFAAVLAKIGTSEEEALRRDIAAAEARLKVKRAEMEQIESQARVLGALLLVSLVSVALISFGASIANTLPTEWGGAVRTGAGTSTKKGVFRMDKKDKASSFSVPAAALLSGAIGAVGANILVRCKVEEGSRLEPEVDHFVEDDKSKEINDVSLEIDEIFNAMEKLQAETNADNENESAGGGGS